MNVIRLDAFYFKSDQNEETNVGCLSSPARERAALALFPRIADWLRCLSLVGRSDSEPIRIGSI